MAEATKPTTAEPVDEVQAFQSSLEDVVTVIENVEGFFESPREMLESMRLACRNRGHARMILNRIKK